MTLLQNKCGLIVGVANERSMAYGIAQQCRTHGADIVLTYQNERLEKRVRSIAEQLGARAALPCDLTKPQDITAAIETLREHFGRLDFLVHAVAHANREDLEGRFVDTSRDGFTTALDVSVYSLVELVRATEPLLKQSSCPSVLTLSYYGSEKAMPSYNVMGVAKAALEASVRYLANELGVHGIRVNALSPGPVRTLSAAGIRGLRRMLDTVEANAPLRRNIDIDDVGKAAVFALSDLSSAMTGEVVHIDAGYHVVGAPPES